MYYIENAMYVMCYCLRLGISCCHWRRFSHQKISFFSTTSRSFFHPAYSDALSKFFQAHLHNHACQPDWLIRIGHNIRMQKLRVRMRNFFKENPNENIRRKKIISMTGKWKKNARKCFRLSGESSRWWIE